MGNYNLGEARGKIVLETDFNGLSEGQKAVKSFKDDTDAAAQSSQDAWRKTGNAAAVGGAVIAGGFAVAVAAAGNFEFSMSAIQAVSGATADEMDIIREAALRIGQDTAYSASEAATAMEELLKSGISVEDVLGGAADATVALAAAGSIELPEAAAIASAAMNQFKLGAEDLVEVTDIMAGAANASATGVSEIGAALSFVGPTAQAAGVSIRDTAQMIALFANNGMDGARAGTSLRALISNLASPTQQATDALKELGLITEEGGNAFFDAEGKMKSMTEVTDLLRGALGGMTSEQQLAYGETLVGRENLSALSAIVNTSAEDFAALGTAIAETSAADVASTRLNNMKGSLEELSGSVETLAIESGTRLIPAVTQLVNSITAAVNWFSGLNDTLKSGIGIAAGVAGGLLLMLAGFVKISQGITAVRAAYTAMNVAQGIANIQSYAATAAYAAQAVAIGVVRGAMAVATAAQWAWNAALTANPIGLIIAAIVALVAGIVWFFTQTELGQAIWTEFTRFLGEAWNNLVEVAQVVWEAIMTAIGAVVDWFQAYVMPVIKFVIDFIIAYYTTLWNIIVAVWTGIQTAVGAVVDWFMEHVYPAIEAFINFLIALFNYLWLWVVFIWEAIVAAVTTVVNAWVSFFTTVFTELGNFWRDIWNAISSFVTDIWNQMIAFLVPIFLQIYSTIQTVFNNVRSFIVTVFTAVQSFFTSVWNAISSVVSTVVNAVWSVISGTWNQIVGFVTTTFNNVKSAIENPIKDALKFLGTIKDKIMGFFAGAGDWLYNAGKSIIEGFINGLEDMFSNVTSFFNNLTNMIPEVKGPPERDKVLLENNGELIMQSLINGLQNKTGKLMGMLGDLNSGIPAAISQDISARVNGLKAADKGIVLNLEYYAAAGDGTKTKQDVINMLGHATELVREELK